MTPELDIVIPVYNEGRNIVATLAALAHAVTTPARVLICYDHADDDTLPAIRDNPQAHAGLAGRVRAQRRPRRPRRGHDRLCRQHRAVRPDVSRRRRLPTPPMLDRMVALARDGCDIVCASRFMPGGAMVGCPLAQGGAGAHGELHAAPSRPAADHRCQQRLPAVLAPGDRADRGRVRPGLLLQHRAAGEGASARLDASAKCRCAGSSAGMAPAASACSSGCRPICAGTATPSPLPCCGGRRTRSPEGDSS